LSATVTESAAQTETLGARLAAELGPGDVVLVSGELGSGKTTLIRGACRTLGVPEAVVSPTFTIGRRYSGRIPVSHVDLYRLDGLEGEDPGLLDDYLTPDAISFVEWPEIAGELTLVEGTRIARRIELRHAGGDRREVELNDPRPGVELNDPRPGV
jgi:tRNA threonylcarbamoyladenosine biosynthesis protein TsaE